jgi:uncharacterized YccA/Bax inhibitor family protein
MRTSNPALSDKALARTVPADHLQAGWAAPTHVPPAPDTVSPWTSAPPIATDADVMTVSGSVSATAVLLVLVLAGGVVGWSSTEVTLGTVELPGWLLLAFVGALGLAIATIFRPGWARVTAPLYALVEGTVLGAISHLYEAEFDGIVLQAAGLTVGVLAVMLFLHATRIIKATDKFRMGVVMATGAIAVVYVFDLLLRLFGTEVPFIHDTGTFGILISLAIVVVASLNLILDFDFVERGVAARAPKSTEWYAAFGLLLTLVWLYLELLRLLAKLQRD